MSENSNPRPTARKSRGRKRGRRRRRQQLPLLPILIGAGVLLLLILILCLRSCLSGSSDHKAPGAAVETIIPTTDVSPESDIAEEASQEMNTSEDITSAESEASEVSATGFIGELPDIDPNSWEYILVNSEHTLDKSFAPTTVKVEGVKVDKRIADALKEFVAAARDQKLKVYMSSAYRSYGRQSTLFQKKLKQGYSKKKAATIIAIPGTSEHQTGLAADITDVKRKTKNKSLEKTATYKWMKEHCYEYGFVVRYPNDKSDITGIIYEPWHFRYVGKEVAKFMTENNLCLEEFLALYETEADTEQ